MHFPEPVISISIEPKSKADSDNLDLALDKLTLEDPTFKVQKDEDTGQTIISGMGELHLEILIDRLLREFNLKAHVGRPQVSYRETVTELIEAEGVFDRQTGGKSQYGSVQLKIEPNGSAPDFHFFNRLPEGLIPREFIPAIERGVRNRLKSGILAGYPMQRLRVTLTDATYRDMESTELAFEIAASLALEKGLKEAKPAILEPIMALEVVVPDDYLGDVLKDLNARKANILEITKRNNMNVVNARIPLRQIFGYATDLRSITQGRAVFTLQFAAYDFCDEAMQRKIIEKTRGFLPEFIKN
jgi:elongation factor G